MSTRAVGGPAPGPGATARQARRALRAAALAAGCAVALHAAALAALSTAPARAWMRARVHAALEDRLGETSIGAVSVDWRLRLVAEALRARPAPGHAPGVELTVDRVRASLSPWALLAGRLEPARIELRGARLSGPLALGPVDAVVRLGRGAGRLEAALRLAGGGAAEVHAVRDAGGARIRLAASGLGPEDLPPAWRGEAARVAAGSLAV